MAGQIGYLSEIRIDDGVSAAFVAIANVVSIKLPQLVPTRVKITHLQSPSLTHEYVAGFKEPGECSFEANYSPATYARLLLAKGVAHNFEVETPEGGVAEFAGYIASTELDIPTEEKMMLSCTIVVNGTYTFTAA